MGEGRYLKGEHIGMVWCTGAQCDGQGKKKSGDQHQWKKGQKQKKRFVRQKFQQKKKMKKVIIMVLGEIDPAPLWRQI